MLRHLARIAAPLLVVVYCLAPPPGAAADGPENPVYKNWAGFKKGASVTYKCVSEVPGTRYESTMTYSLVELTPDKAVVEIQVTVKSGGKETRNRPQRFDNPRVMTLPPGAKPDQPGKVEGLLEEGEEILKVGGRDYKSKWYKARSRVEGAEVLTQSWSSDEVPGGLAKSTTGTPAAKTSMTMELVEVRLP